jgi:multiple sugar transport system substrate-binding protein
MIKRATITLLLPCLLLSVILGGCGRREAAKEKGVPQGQLSLQKKLQISTFFGLETMPGFLARIEMYQQERPEIEVAVQHTPWNGYVPKLIVQMATNTAPDIVMTEVAQAPAMIEKGVVIPLNEYIERDGFDLNRFSSAVIDRFTRNGKIYGIVADANPVCVVFYNRRLFNEANIPYPPKYDWDIHDLLSLAQRLTRRDAKGKIIQYGFYSWDWRTFVYMFGGSIVDSIPYPTRCTLDDPQAIAGLQFYRDLTTRYHVMPTPTELSDFKMGANKMFLTERVAMFHSGLWENTQLSKATTLDYNVALFPKGPDGHRGWGSGGTAWCVSVDADPEAAWDLIKYLLSEEAFEINQKHVTSLGGAPAVIEWAKGEFFALDPRPPQDKDILIEGMNHIRYTPFHPDWTQIDQTIISPAMELMMNGEKTVEETVREIVPKVNAKLNGNRLSLSPTK